MKFQLDDLLLSRRQMMQLTSAAMAGTYAAMLPLPKRRLLKATTRLLPRPLDACRAIETVCVRLPTL